MDIFRIQGKTQLQGEVSVSGSKNAVLPIISASIMGSGPSLIKKVPPLRDVRTLIDIIKHLGVKVSWESEDSLLIDPRGIYTYEAPYSLVKKMRASICLLGPLLGAYGKAKISLPGGCVIGPRPVDIHLNALKQLGIKVHVDHGNIIAEGRIKGGEVFLGGRYGSSVTATANLAMAAVLGKGTTIIEYAAVEPEVTDLLNFLVSMGAKISGINSHVLTIEGVPSLSGTEYEVIPDRIEAGTFAIGSAMTQGDVLIKGCRWGHLRALNNLLLFSGASLSQEKDGLRVTMKDSPIPADIITLPYPGFPTDLQAQMMALMSLGSGISVITEKIYPERFMHISELNRMGAQISLEGPTAIIKGVNKLSGAPVMASDLRASAALVLAGIAAEGETEIERVYHIDRGYHQIEKKLHSLGAKVSRESRPFP